MRATPPTASRRLGLLAVVGLLLGLVPLLVGSAGAAGDVSYTPLKKSSCNAERTTPGSENTLKDIVGGTLERGGTAVFRISYPVDAVDLGDDFKITDCFERTDTGAVLDAVDIEFVPNNTDFSFTYTLDIPASVPVGTQVCNYAKTTQTPSQSQGSNRKGAVCFAVGGTLRVEKHDSATGAVVPGAQFSVACTPVTAFPSLVVSGLEDARPDGTAVTGNPVTGYANNGAIAVSGPEGTPCTVTELAAPPGYALPAPADRVHQYSIPASGSGTGTHVVLNTAVTATPTLGKSSVPATGSTVSRGTSIAYTVTVGNTGTAPATGDVVDTLPAALEDITGVSDGGVVDTTAGTITWTGVQVAAGATRTLTYSAVVADDAPLGDVTNTVAWKGLTASTTHTVGTAAPTLSKSSVPATGSTVQAGDLITYTVVAGNTGSVPVVGATVVDALPASFVLDPTSVTAPGVVDAAAGTITWDLGTLAVGATRTLSYSGLVGAVTSSTTLTNTARFQGLERSTTHTALPGGLGLVKDVTSSDPAVNPGDTLTYSLTATATGEVTEQDVVVTDHVPGSDPARPGSGRTTLVAGSPACVGSGPCEVSVDAATGLISWEIGDLEPGDTRTVTFAATVDQPATAGAAVADVLNAGAVEATRTPSVPSNQVRTPVTVVLPEVVTPTPTPTPTPTTTSTPAPKPAGTPRVLPFVPPQVLPFTGAWVLPVLSTGLGAALLGALLVGAGRRRRSA